MNKVAPCDLCHISCVALALLRPQPLFGMHLYFLLAIWDEKDLISIKNCALCLNIKSNLRNKLCPYLGKIAYF